MISTEIWTVPKRTRLVPKPLPKTPRSFCGQLILNQRCTQSIHTFQSMLILWWPLLVPSPVQQRVILSLQGKKKRIHREIKIKKSFKRYFFHAEIFLLVRGMNQIKYPKRPVRMPDPPAHSQRREVYSTIYIPINTPMISLNPIATVFIERWSRPYIRMPNTTQLKFSTYTDHA